MDLWKHEKDALRERGAVWMPKIRERFDGSLIAGVGTTVGPKETSDRRINWNADVADVWNPLSANAKPDAFTLHHYPGTGLGDLTSGLCEYLDYTDGGAYKKWQKVFFTPFKAMNNYITTQMGNINGPGNYKTWFTEFNLGGKDYYTNGSWAHALYAGAMAMQFAEESTSQIACLHNMIGDFSSAAIFGYSNNDGFTLKGPDPNCEPSELISAPTTDYSLTAVGLLMRELNIASRGAVNVNSCVITTLTGTMPMLQDEAIPDIPAHDAVYAIVFTDAAGNRQHFILNLNPASVGITSYGASAPQQYIQYSFDVNDFIRKVDLNQVSNHVDYTRLNDPVLMGPTDVYGASIPQGLSTYPAYLALPGYSLTRLVYESTTAIAATVVNADICAGETAQLRAVGSIAALGTGAYPNWTGGGFNYAGASVDVTGLTTTTTFTLQGAGGATSATVTVTVHATPTFTVAQSTANPICPGASVTLTPSDNTLFYNWTASNPEGLPVNPIVTTLTVTPAASTVYTVYGSNGFCSAKQTVTVDVLNTVSFEVNPVSYCLSGSGAILDPGPDVPLGLDYEWTPSNNLSSSTERSPTANPAVITTYTVTVTDSPNSCTTTGSITVIPVHCCTAPTNTNLVIDDATDNNDIITLIGTACGTCLITNDPVNSNIFIIDNIGTVGNFFTILVQSKWNIYDRLTLMGNIEIEVAEAGEINLHPYSRLVLDNIDVTSCASIKWKGFNAMDKSEMQIINTSEVRDAEYAVKLGKHTKVKFEESVFYNNHIGVYVPSTGFAKFYNPVAATITNCDFLKHATDPMLPNYIGQTTPLLSNPYAAIEVHEAIMSIAAESKTKCNNIGSGSGSTTGLLNGIRSFNSVLGVANTKVTNIMSGGIGIYAQSSSMSDYANLTQSGMGTTTSFDFCERAIFTNRSSYSISKNKTENTDVFTTNFFPPVGSIDSIFKNQGVAVNNYGIISNGSYMASTLDITDNDITVAGVNPATATAAIALYNAPGSICSTLINENECTLSGNALYGIRTTLVENTHIKCNTVDMPFLNNLEGISGFLMRNGEIDNNEVTGFDALDVSINNGQVGYRIVSSNNNFVHFNTSDHTGIGFKIEGTCLMDELGDASKKAFRANQMYNHYEGLHITANGNFGPQENMGNRWLGAYENFGAINYNVPTNSSDPFLSEIRVYNYSTSTFKPSVPSTMPNNTTWFKPFGTSDLTNTSINCATYLKSSTASRNGLDTIIAADTLHCAVFEEETDWQAKRDLYMRIKQDPSLLSDDLYAEFYENMAGTDLARLATIDYELSQLCTLSDNNFETLHCNDSTIQSLMKQVAVIDSMIAIDSLEQDLTLAPLKTALFDTVATLANESSELQASEHDCIKALAATLIDLNDEVEGDTAYTDNEKQVNAIVLYNLANDIDGFTSTQLDTLFNIASQCPFEGGIAAVTKARVKLAEVTDTLLWNDSTLCSGRGYYKIMEKQASQINEISLMPNPANEAATVFLSQSFDKNCTLSLFSYLGNKIAEFPIATGKTQITIDVRNLPAGLYVLQVNEQKDLRAKLMVIK